MSGKVSVLRYWLLLSLLSFAVAALGCAEAGSEDDDDDTTVRIDASPSVTPDGGGGGGCSSCDPATSNGCSEDRCVCNLGPACSGGSTCCSLGCRNLDNDPNNCGQCGRPCGANQTCMGGECVCSFTGTDCGALDCCSTGCVDTSTDTANCGSCDNACEGGDVCAGGACNCSFECPIALPFGSKIVCCGDGCYDICNDANHCGGCDPTTCDSCSIGACAVGTDEGTPDLLNCFSFPF